MLFVEKTTEKDDTIRAYSQFFHSRTMSRIRDSIEKHDSEACNTHKRVWLLISVLKNYFEKSNIQLAYETDISY